MPTLNTNTSVVDAAKSKGLDSSFGGRAKLAEQYGIKNYAGDANQNEQLRAAILNDASYNRTTPTPTTTVGGVGTTAGPTPGLTESINSGQDADIEAGNRMEEPEMRAGVAPELKSTFGDLRDILETGLPERPEADSFSDSYTKLRSQYGLRGLEGQLNDLTLTERELQSDKRGTINREMGKPVALNVIQGRVGEAERNANERLDFIGREKAYVSSQIQSAYSAIDTIMKYKKMDYDLANDAYNEEFSQNLQMFNATQGYLDRQQDNARANGQIILNTLIENGAKYDTLDPKTQNSLTQLGVQSGLGAAFFKDALSNSSKPVLTTIKSGDGSRVTLVYKDGSTRTIATGVTTSGSGSGGYTPQELRKLRAAGIDATDIKKADDFLYNGVEPAEGEEGATLEITEDLAQQVLDMGGNLDQDAVFIQDALAQGFAIEDIAAKLGYSDEIIDILKENIL